MLSKDAATRPFNRGNYVAGAPTPPRYGHTTEPAQGEAYFQTDPVTVPAAVLEELKASGAEVLTDHDDVVLNTRDWWAGSMIGETAGQPATPTAVIVKTADTDQVSAVMRIADAHRLPVTPSAGRSNVTGAALPVKGGIVLDVCALNRILEYDEESQVVEVEAGMFGDIFEAEIQQRHGVTLGHWPSSYAISTIGGWIACRGAGQLSTRYGKIEDMVLGMDIVLPGGEEISVGGHARAAIGPDLQSLFIGSEGTLGVIVRARLKAHRLPDYSRALAYGFTTFADGLEACRRILQSGANPAALRLYDELESGVQFDRPDTNVLLIADEGFPEFVDANMTITERACSESGVALDGEACLERWLDTRYLTGKSGEGFTPSPGFVADTLEMIGRWRDLPQIYEDVVEAINSVPGTLAASAHQSHAYVDGACLYFSLRGQVEPEERADWYRAAWDAANGVLLKADAGLSHHHGVGLLRAPYLPEALGGGFDVLRSVKGALDPHNILNPGKLGLT